MNKVIKRKIAVILALILVILMLIDVKSVVSAEDDKVQFDLTFDFASVPGQGHTWMGGSAPSTPLEKTMVESWKNLTIKVTDSEGNVFDSPKEYKTNYVRDGGKYKDGEKLTIEIDPSGLPDDYHISWNGEDSYHKVKYISGYYKMEYTITKANMNAKLFYIKIGKLTTKFDMMGGTSSSGDSPIVRVVKKDNSVDFPKEPTKENLHFGGWFTRSGDYQRYWTNKDSFSDLNRDWWQYNDFIIDPMYDGFFVLRARWNAYVTFNSDGGTEFEKAVVEEGTKVSYPGIPTKKDARFLYWQDENGEPYDWSKPVTMDMTLKAIWQENAKVDITFDPNNGKWKDTNTAELRSKKAEVSKDINMLDAPVRDGYTFQYWRGSTYAAGANYKIEPEHKFTAVWKKNEVNSDSENPSVKPCNDTTNPSAPGNSGNKPGTPNSGTTKNVNTKKGLNTGDDMVIYIYGTALLATVGGIIVLKRIKKKEK